jgi:hypothetical protein
MSTPSALDYIQIANLSDGADECFAGLYSSVSASATGGIGGTTPGGTTQPTEPVGAIPDDLQKWIDTMTTVIDQITPWVDASVDIGAENFDYNEANPESRGITRDVPALPAPVTPAPRIPRDPVTLGTIWVEAGGGATGTIAVMVYLGTSYASEYVEAWIRKKLEKGDDAEEFQTKLLQAVRDLQYNDEVIDFGTIRLLLKGKVIEY